MCIDPSSALVAVDLALDPVLLYIMVSRDTLIYYLQSHLAAPLSALFRFIPGHPSYISSLLGSTLKIPTISYLIEDDRRDDEREQE